MTNEPGLFDTVDEHIDKLNSEKPKEKQKRNHRRTTALQDITVEDEYRRAFGLQELLRLMRTDKPQPGHSYHIISGGNVDLIAHVRWILLHWPRLKRLFISAWAISAADIMLFRRWLEKGEIMEADILVGDVFPANYKHEWAKLQEMYNSGMIRNLYCATIHSKLILIETEEGQHICVESSANCNMNPRVEQSVVTLNSDLYNFYMQYFDDIFEEQRVKRINLDMQQLELNTTPDDADCYLP